MFPREWIISAAERVSPHITRTPVTYDPRLDAHFKWENQQITGSFKARGAFNKVLALEPWERDAGLVAASAGNHGQGVALAAGRVGALVTVFVPDRTPAVKIEKMRALGAELRLVAGGYDEAETAGLRFARETEQTWISPYNDPKIVAGQGTIGLELAEQVELKPETNLLIPVGGGGLLAGIASALYDLKSHPRIIGVQPAASAFMHALYRGGGQEGVPDLPTLADGLAGGVQSGSMTIPLVQALADDILLVNEDEIARAVAFAWHHYQQQIEGSAAVGLAAVLGGAIRSPFLLVVSGGNIQPELHADILSCYPETA